jgi:diguanylate cyclase (GGDEF)-like protein
MMDIDYFKAINDRYGHPAGDAVIREVAGILRAGLRLHDVPGRYGGEEFGIVLPGTGIEGAEVLAERIRTGIESGVLDAGSGARATASLGIAAYDSRDASHADWIARADRALYRAKESGRNRTVHDATPAAPAQLPT